MEPSEAEGDGLFPKRVGERLAEARRAAGLDLSDIASRTRVPLRQLEALEAGRYEDLPAVTYCIGFAKSYARALGIDEVSIARDIRAELNVQERGAVQYFEPADPARVPPRALAWTLLVLVILVGGGFAIFRTGMIDGLGGRDPMALAAGTDSMEAQNAAVATARRAPASPAGGDVVLTATDTVWLRISDADGQRLFEKEMAAGERYQLPGNAKDPRIVTGRPDAIAVTVGGQAVPPLGAPQATIRDVPINAAALLARPPADAPANAQAPQAGPAAR